MNGPTMLTPRVKLLIVDDEVRNLDALEVLLEASECEFVRATSAEEALLAMLRHDFAAIPNSGCCRSSRSPPRP